MIEIAAPSRLTANRIAKKIGNEKLTPNRDLPSETVTYAPTRYTPAKVSDTRPAIYKTKFSANDNMIMYETIGRALKTYEKSVLSICGCLSECAGSYVTLALIG